MTSRWIDAGWVLILGVGSSAWCLTAGAELGATFDEPSHIAAGLESWRTGSNKQLMTWGAMPLPIDVQTLPIYLWERHRGVPFSPYVELKTILPVARAAGLVFWWLLLVYGLLWGRALGGPWAGRFAVGFLAADPNLLGHAALSTTDICLTAMVLLATYHFREARERSWGGRIIVPGVLYGLALAAKASALPYVPLLWGVFGLAHLAKQNQLPNSLSLKAWYFATDRLRWDMVFAGIIGVVVAFAYCGSDWSTEPTFVTWAYQLPDGPVRDAVKPVAETLAIFPNAGEGLVQQVKHNFRGHGGACVAGEWHDHAVWYYFPVTLSAKLADPTLVLLGLMLVLRPRALLSPAGWAVLALLLFSLNARVQIGVRLVFPLMAFLHVALAVALMRRSVGCAEELPLTPVPSPEGSKMAFACGLLYLLWSGLLIANGWPDGLRYTNSLWGGTDRGAAVLGDSNYDWGQGMPALRRWSDAEGNPQLHVWYFGGDPAVLCPPFRHLPVHQLPTPGVEAVRSEVGNGYLAVSVSLFTVCPDRRAEVLEVLAWLRGLAPVARTGTFVIFQLP